MSRRLVAVLLAHSACVAQAQAPASKPSADGGPIHLLKRYPTSLAAAVLDPGKARPWLFDADNDIYRLSRFVFDGPDGLRIKTGPADLGIGHCEYGAVWAVIIPRRRGQLVSSASRQTELFEHIWLRMHPSQLETLFPSETLRGAGDRDKAARIIRIARHKMSATFHAGQRAMVPPPETLVFDVDTLAGVRRLFLADRKKNTTQYVAAFENQAVPPTTPISKDQALDMFDRVWRQYDEHYPMFILRPEIDWDALRKRYEPKAAKCTNTYELGQVLAEMLRSLRDMHIWITAGREPIMVYSRPRPWNVNPQAAEAILGELQDAPGGVRWTRTKDDIGVIIIPKWTSSLIPPAVDDILEQLRSCRALIIDVRANGGGNEMLARQVAGRFTTKPVAYAYQRYRNGPEHDNLTPMMSRMLEPRGPWCFDKPVLVLIGQHCVSSNEGFAAMMSVLPQVTLMGDHTAGSSGNPQWLKLEAGLTVSMPRWIAYRPDRQPIDERGIEPDIRFEPTSADAFEGNRDDLLTAALERARKLVAQTKSP